MTNEQKHINMDNVTNNLDDENYTFEMFLESFCVFADYIDDNNEANILQHSTENNRKQLEHTAQPNQQSNKKIFRCDQCNQTFHSKGVLWYHKKSHTGIKYSCKYCKRTFNCSNNRRMHEETHSNERNYKCPYCFSLFKNQSSCIRHTKYNCKSKPNDPSKIKQAIDIRKVFDMETLECDFCDKVFVQQSMLEVHQDKCHSQDEFSERFGQEKQNNESNCDKRLDNRFEIEANNTINNSMDEDERNEYVIEMKQSKNNPNSTVNVFDSNDKLNHDMKKQKTNHNDEYTQIEKTIDLENAREISTTTTSHDELPFQCLFCLKRFKHNSSRSRHHRTYHKG